MLHHEPSVFVTPTTELLFSHAKPQVSNSDKGMFLRCTSTHSLVLRSNDSTDKINSDLGTVALARPISHTGSTQALWSELGVRNGGCQVAYVSWRCNSSFQVAPRALKKGQEKPGDELATAGNSRLCTVPRHASFGSLMKAKKKKKIGRYDLNCNSTGCKVGLTSMLRNCVSYFFSYARTLACDTCSYTNRKLPPSRTFPGWHSPAPY